MTILLAIIGLGRDGTPSQESFGNRTINQINDRVFRRYGDNFARKPLAN